MAEEKKTTEMRKDVELPQGVTAEVGDLVTVKGPKGEVTKDMKRKKIEISVKDNTVSFVCAKPTKREKMMINTLAAHLRTMINGVQNLHHYTLKICSGHFPMNVSMSGETLQVKNFFGEKTPRVLQIKKGATVKVEGDLIQVESIDKGIAGQVSADIEQLTRRVNFDPRIFQDGIYIINKDGKEIK